MGKNSWACKIGEVDHDTLPHGADAPMRKAALEAYVALTGEEPAAIFSGWGSEFDESERAVIEDRAPNPALTGLQGNEQYRQQMAGICTAALGYWKEGGSIHPDYDTPALRDVARLYAKYDALYQIVHAPPALPDAEQVRQAATGEARKVTIDELEKIISDEGELHVHLNSDGSITTGPRPQTDVPTVPIILLDEALDPPALPDGVVVDYAAIDRARGE